MLLFPPYRWMIWGRWGLWRCSPTITPMSTSHGHWLESAGLHFYTALLMRLSETLQVEKNKCKYDFLMNSAFGHSLHEGKAKSWSYGSLPWAIRSGLRTRECSLTVRSGSDRGRAGLLLASSTLSCNYPLTPKSEIQSVLLSHHSSGFKWVSLGLFAII